MVCRRAGATVALTPYRCGQVIDAVRYFGGFFDVDGKYRLGA